MWHRMAHLQASNLAGERGRGRAAERPPPLRTPGTDNTGAPGRLAGDLGGPSTSADGGGADGRTAVDGTGEVGALPAGGGPGAGDAAVAGDGASSNPVVATQANPIPRTAAEVPTSAPRGAPPGLAAGSAGQERSPGIVTGATEAYNTELVDKSVNTGLPFALGGAARFALDPKNVSDRVCRHIVTLLAVSRHPVAGTDPGRGSKRRRPDPGDSSAAPEYTYTTVSTAAQALYEEEGDWEHSDPLVNRRKGWRPGRFDFFRLRAVQRFALESGGGGISLERIEKLWDLLDTWDRTKPGMPIDGGHDATVRDSFNSVDDFKNAVRDDVDDAVLGAGCVRCPLVVDGQKFVVFFRPVLEVILDMLKRGKDVRIWSGETGPAPPSKIRETPMDGDAFRLNEAELMTEKKDGSCFVLGFLVYSDASQLSWSGGVFPLAHARGEQLLF